jgi:hypothetical protein
MKKFIAIILAAAALAITSNAQIVTNGSTVAASPQLPALNAASWFPTPSAPTGTNSVQSAVGNVFAAFTGGNTNWFWVPYGLYAPGLKHKAGGGIGLFWPVSQGGVVDFYTGVRVDYVDGGFWMPSGNATLAEPINVASWFQITPLTYAGIGVPLSGATIGNIKVPGQAKDNNGQATAILGYGISILIYQPVSQSWSIGLIGDAENWSGFPKQQWRFGANLNMKRGGLFGLGLKLGKIGGDW